MLEPSKCVAFGFLAILMVACTDGGNLSAPGTETACEAPMASTSSAPPLERLEISGVDNSLEGLYALVSSTDGATTIPTLVEPLGGDRVAVVVPIHPRIDADGGEASIIITNDQVECPAVAFLIEPLPETERSFGEAVLMLEDIIENVAQNHGTTAAAFTDTSELSFPPHLIPLATAYNMLAHPGNPVSLKAIAEGRASSVNGIELDMEFLDRYAAHVDLFQALDETLAFVTEVGSATGAATIPGARADGAMTLGETAVASSMGVRPLSTHVCASDFRLFEIDGPAELNEYMQAQSLAESRLEGVTGKVIEDTAYAMSWASLAGPTGKGIAMLYGGYAATVLETYEAYTHLFPGHMDLHLQLAPAEFEEDNPGPGKWTATATAYSKLWNLNEKIFEKLLDEALGDSPVTGGVFSDKVPDKIKEEIDNYVLKDPAKETLGWFLTEIGANEGANGFYIPEQCWDGFPVSDEMWTEAKVQFDPQAAIRLDANDRRLYHPRAAGTGTIEINTRSGKFGNDMEIEHRTVEVKPIEVFLDPFQAVVQPGERVVFTASVENALDTGLAWETTGGYFDTTVVYPDGTHEAILVTPGDASVYPFEVKAISTANGGIRESGPERSDSSEVLLGTFEILVSPNPITIQAGASGEARVTISTTSGATPDPLSLSLEGAPAGVTHAFDPGSTSVASTLTLSVGEDVPPGTYPMVVRGSSGDTIGEAPLALTVMPAGEVLDVSGTWVGTVDSLYGTQTLKMVILQAGDVLEAWMVFGASRVLNDVPGTLEGDVVTFVHTLDSDPSAVHREIFEGIVSGETMSGTYTVTYNDSVRHQGAFTVTRE